MYSKRKRPVNNFNCIQMHLSRNNVLLLLQAFDAITLQRYTLYTSAKYSIEISINWAIWYCVLIFDINLIGHMVPFCVDGHIWLHLCGVCTFGFWHNWKWHVFISQKRINRIFGQGDMALFRVILQCKVIESCCVLLLQQLTCLQSHVLFRHLPLKRKKIG